MHQSGRPIPRDEPWHHQESGIHRRNISRSGRGDSGECVFVSYVCTYVCLYV